MDGEKGRRVRFEIVEHSDKRPARQRLGDLPQGLLREAESRQGPDDRQFGVVGRQRSLDPDRARAESPFGTTIAHGFLTVSLLSVFSYEALPEISGATRGVNYGFDKLRFITPVRAGSRLRGRFTLMEATLRGPDVLTSRTSVSVEIEGAARPALVADWISLIYFA